MKNTIKLFGIIALAALIGFAITACTEDTTKDITWTAVADGTANTVTSTKITFTFSEAVTGLLADDINLTGGGVVTKGALTAGTGNTWELGITVTTPGTVSVKITKEGISATAQNVAVYKEGEVAAHPISGRTSWVYDATTMITSQITFSAINGTGGTFELNGLDWGDYTGDPTWTSIIGEGTYTWNESAGTVTLTTTKVGMMDYETFETVLKTKSEVETIYRTQIEEEAEYTISSFLEEDVWEQDEDGNWTQGETITRTEEEALAYFLEMMGEYKGTVYESVDDYVEGELAEKLEVFDPRPYTYFSVSGTLVLLEALPVSAGSNELSGKTFTISGFEGIEAGTFTFNANGTFSATATTEDEISITTTGTYSYNSTKKRVYVKPDKVSDLTPEEFFSTTDPSEFGNYPTEEDDRAAQTNENFPVGVFIYNINGSNTLTPFVPGS